ncbi:MAG TPA: pyruvate:ferredoxin (flavodoxin) oxidoreductase, partial [Actinomycetota bacterium]|nr:pyruvate:ferredoxin (flavodoxin) oxidoreductase [Actinomycetota bacterium]
MTTWTCMDGNEAAARVAYRLSEVVAIYPITPASPMGELSDAWSAAGQPNLWGSVPHVIEMQSEAGAAGAIHGALQRGSLATTFTASQGLLLMLPNMYKIAGELSPGVIHVAARSIATHALSIFGDHSDVMGARATGFAMLSSSSVQEAQDFALIAHATALSSRVPFLHFFDGFRTSHEVDKIALLADDEIAALIDPAAIAAHRARRLTPDAPSIRGTAQNPDVFFQAREAANPYYLAVPGLVRDAMAKLADVTGRSYDLVDYDGSPDAERVIVTMGSSRGAAVEAVNALTARGEKVGLITIRLYRPFPSRSFLEHLPASVRSIAVLDRTKEPGASGEPLYQDIVTALSESDRHDVRVVGGRYGLSSKEFTPAMAAAVFDDIAAPAPKNHFTVGIADDVTGMSLDVPPLDTDTAAVRAVFYGLGSDGTVSANKSAVKIVGEETDLFAQGYFVYDSKKSGSTTVSHLRFDEDPISSTYLISNATFVACHQFRLLERMDILDVAQHGATFLLNSPYGPKDVWKHLPARVQSQILEKNLDFYVIDAQALSRDLGLAGRINTIMQPCFFELTSIVDRDAARTAMKTAVRKQYGKRGDEIVARNEAAIDRATALLHRVQVADSISGVATWSIDPSAPGIVQDLMAPILEGRGNEVPVSALPVDGTFPSGTSKWEKRTIAQELPIWDPDLCIDCGHCVIVCPHAAIRMKVYDPAALEGAPEDFPTKGFHAKEVAGKNLTIQVLPEDCTGCGICVDVCPATSKSDRTHKALDLHPLADHFDVELDRFKVFSDLPTLDPDVIDVAKVKGSQLREPLFEFSGACAGCGETPYVKLLTQLFGDRLLVAYATGCSSIYGGNLPTTPWTSNDEGRGPAWANSLFEDNAEFGMGIRVASDQQAEEARR